MLSSLFHKPEQSSDAFLIIGLGNPGREYRENRHNAGFMVVDRICKELLITPGRVQSKSILATGQYAGHKIYLAKPQTYMNLSGQSVSGLLHYYKIPIERLVVAHDDLDLPFGALRIRPGGGPGGQKGVGSIIQQLGTQQFARIRVGIGRPPGQMNPADYVLQDFSNQEKEVLALVLEKAAKSALTFIESGLEAAMNQFNGVLKEG
jgi:peptidyl-tRNA hydrolase, PTH1 family